MKKEIIKYPEFKGLVSEICRQIAKDNWRPDYIVGITRGGLTPAVMISHYFNIPMYSLHVSLRDSTFGSESNLWMAEDAYGYNGEKKNILIVDDINDTGATFNWIMQDWPSGCLPNAEEWSAVWGDNVRFAVVVDNLSSKCETKMSYVGKEIDKSEEDVWIDFHYESWWK
jgi:hypoxanthine phosphoribosyltransferase